MNAMVFSMEKKRVAQTIREMPRDDYALIDAQKMMDANDAVNAMQSMLEGRFRTTVDTYPPWRQDRQPPVRKRSKGRMGGGVGGVEV